MSTQIFDVDKQGLAKLLARRGIEFAALELAQNALDENVTRVAIKLVRDEERPRHYRLSVEDDSPEGFADLAHAYTLFAESKKKGNAQQRGRFNLGEKLVIAVAKETAIRTTTGTVIFDARGRHRSSAKRQAGTVVETLLPMTADDAARTERALRSVLVPPTIIVTLDLGAGAERLPSSEPLRSFTATLPTEVADEDGYLRPTERQTDVHVHAVREGETPTLYELGIPVVALDCAWHVDVQQKVPLNTDRDNVTPAYARRLRALVLNEMHEQLGEHAKAAWVTDAIESKLASTEAVEAVITERYGEKRVIRDPSDPEGTKLAMSQGFAIIEPGSFSGSAWESIRRAGAALPAGQVTPSPKVIFSADGRDVDYPRDKWTPGMERIVEFSKLLGEKLLRGRVYVAILNDFQGHYAACFGDGCLQFNVARLGKAWFDKSPLDEAVLQLLIHEFGHHYEMDHLSEGYHDALCKLGARLGRLALDEPAFFAKWRAS